MTTNDPKPTNDEIDEAMDLMATFQMTQVERRTSAGGAWVTGTIGGHRFEALVFAEHAECESYELRDTRISKLHLQRIADKAEVACFDRGWDREPTTSLAQTIVDLLGDGLAEAVFAS